MQQGLWKQLSEKKKPFFVLAPMANVTDTVFRQIIVKYGRPDAVWTEFVPCDGLCSNGREAVLRDLQFLPEERPIVAQIFGANPDHFYETAKIIAELGFDGIDINMGCPDKTIVKTGSCSALIKTPELAQAIIKATKKGIGDSGKKIDLSVKTRLGFYKDEIETWIPKILETNIDALIIHGRTRKEMSKTPARWDAIKKVAEMAHESGAIVIGNGDVKSIADAREKAAFSGVDGVMLGRAIFGNPWLFREGFEPSLEEKLKVMVEHTHLFEKTWGDTKSFELMKKHYKAYVNGFDGAKALRVKLMNCHSAEAIEKITTEFLNQNKTAGTLVE